MKEIPWDQPVTLHITGDGIHMVDGPLGALQWLLNRWPIDEGEELMVARKAAHRALEGVFEGDISRDAFIAAAEEAEIHVQE